MIGQAVSHYRVLEQIGEGGMGVVYRAEDTVLHRTVALKVLPPELVSDPVRRDRFMQEARAASSINHPNIAQIYELGEDDGVHFIAMELIEGKTLRRLRRTAELPLIRLVELMIQVTDALAKAHAKGIVHRDLKPDNVMVNDDGQAKVLDFGLAKLIPESPSESLSEAATQTFSKTRPGAIMGTPLYMSPEQAQGKPVDTRSDVFSAGVVMYEMATGRHPFVADTIPEILTAILRRNPQPISEIDESIPLEFQRIVAKSLAKRRRDRYQDIKDLWVDLRHLKRETESGSSPRVADFRSHERRRLSRPFRAAAAVGILAAVAAGWMWSSRERPENATGKPSVAVYWFENLSGSDDDSYFAEGMTEELISELWKVSGLRVSTWDDIQPFRKKTLAATELGNRLRYDYVLTGTVRRAADQVRITPRLIDVSAGKQVWTAQFNDVLENVFSLQDAVALQIARELRVTLNTDERDRIARRPTDSREAHDHYLQGRFHYYRATPTDNEFAVKAYNKALQLDPDYALALAGLADAYVQRYKERFDYDEHWLDEAHRLIDAALERDPDLAEAFESRAEALLEDRRYVDALAAAEQARRLRPDWDEPYLRLGQIYYDRREFRRSANAFDRALRLRSSVEGLCGKAVALRDLSSEGTAEALKLCESASALDPDHHLPYLCLADLYYNHLEDEETGVSMSRKAIAARPDRAEAYLDVASHLDKTGRTEEGEALLREFLANHRYHWEAYEALHDYLAWWKGDYAAALEVVRQALENNPDRVWPHLLLAGAQAWGLDTSYDPDRAQEAIAHALTLRPNSVRVLDWAATILSDLGKTDEALEHLVHALELSPGSVDILEDLVWVLVERREYEKAAEYTLEVIRQAPAKHHPYNLLANAWIPLGKNEEYLRFRERAAEDYANVNPSFLWSVCRERRFAGRFQEALEACNRRLAIKPVPTSQIDTAITLWTLGRTDEALMQLREVDDDWMAAHHAAIAMLKSEARFDEIEEYLDAVHERNPQTWANVSPLYYASMRRYDEALAALERARAEGGSTWIEYGEMQAANYHRFNGSPGLAQRILEAGVKNYPAAQRSYAWSSLSGLSAAAGDLEAALVQLEKATGGRVRGAGERVFAAQLHLALGQSEEALREIREIRGAGSDAASGPLYMRERLLAVLDPDTRPKPDWGIVAMRLKRNETGFWATWWSTASAYRARTLALMGRRAEALAALERALKLEPESSDTAYQAAATHALLGEKQPALEWIRTAVDRGHQQLWWARVDPDLSSLRGDPRYDAIIAHWDSRLRALFD